MSKKVWYEIQVECTQVSIMSDMKVGDKIIVAKVKGKTDSYVVANSLETIYRAPYYEVSIVEQK